MCVFFFFGVIPSVQDTTNVVSQATPFPHTYASLREKKLPILFWLPIRLQCGNNVLLNGLQNGEYSEAIEIQKACNSL